MKYLCIHGHFYQPPRENAWREVIETQDSAFPFHDWNSRICAECYGPNALARVLNGNKELVDLVNNYSRISFNFGPTLLSWMENNEPQVYKAKNALAGTAVRLPKPTTTLFCRWRTRAIKKRKSNGALPILKNALTANPKPFGSPKQPVTPKPWRLLRAKG